MRSLLLFGVLMSVLSSPIAVWAGDRAPQPSPCVEDSAACRNLAVEVAKLDIADRIKNKVDVLRGSNLLCPEDDPQCCPPELMPVCFQVQRDLVIETRRSYRSASLSNFGDCPFSPAVCESFGSFYCGPGAGWTPWGGCNQISFPPINCFPGWSPSEVGSGCVPPDPCECGFEHNDKGKCVEKKCFSRGIRVPCALLCGLEQELFAERVGTPPKSNLARHLSDREVELEAAKQVHADLKSALEALEKEIKELSDY